MSSTSASYLSSHQIVMGPSLFSALDLMKLMKRKKFISIKTHNSTSLMSTKIIKTTLISFQMSSTFRSRLRSKCFDKNQLLKVLKF